MTLGQLVKAIGLRGELKLRETQDFWSAALESSSLFLLHDAERRPIEVRRQRHHSSGMTALLLNGVEDRSAAEELLGAEVVVDVSRLDVAPPDSLRPFQVRGLSVLLPDGSELGRVEDFMRLPANDVFVVRGHSREHLIPNVPHVVKELDLEGRTLRIDPLPGLLEL